MIGFQWLLCRKYQIVLVTISIQRQININDSVRVEISKINYVKILWIKS